MLPFEALSKALAAGLSIWESKEKTKYVDKLIKLKRDYYEEYNKDLAIRSDAVLDNVQRELCNLAVAFSADVGATHPQNQ